MGIQNHLFACVIAGVISIASAESSAKNSAKERFASSSAIELLPRMYDQIPVEASLHDYVPDNFCLLEEKDNLILVQNSVKIVDECAKNSEIRLLLNK